MARHGVTAVRLPPRTHGGRRCALAGVRGRGLRHAGWVLASDAIASLAEWSPWLPFDEAAVSAPRLPGVYLAQQRQDGALVYVGMAGERRGQGIRGRLTVYRRGKAAVSGLGEAVLDRALADATFVQGQLEQLLAGQPKRAAVWAQDALRWADLHIRWAVTADRPAAVTLERAVLDALATSPLWNRAR